MRKIKVAIDSGPLTSGHSFRGIGFHTKVLIEYLKKEKDIDLNLIDFSKGNLGKFDIVHHQYFHPYFLTIPFNKPTKMVVTIHDLIYLIYPEHYPAGVKGKIMFLIQKKLIKNADAIITISETSKKDIVRFLGVDEGKIFPIYLAPREIFKPIKDSEVLEKTRKKYHLPENFVLYVGDVNYNKNILGLAKACKLAGVSLVMVGKQAVAKDFDKTHPENKPLVDFLAKYGRDKDILRLGFVPDEDLVVLYNLAGLYCQPSFYEGFGLPVLEAFAAGTPVVSARTQALVEIGEGGAVFADPQDPKDMAEKIKEVMEDGVLREQLINTGLEIVKGFSWEKTAKETADVYRKLVNEK